MTGGSNVGDASRWRALNLRAVSITARINVAESSRRARLGSSRAVRDPVKSNLQSLLPPTRAAPLSRCRPWCHSPWFQAAPSSRLRHHQARGQGACGVRAPRRSSISARASGRPDGFLLICSSTNVKLSAVVGRNVETTLSATVSGPGDVAGARGEHAVRYGGADPRTPRAPSLPCPWTGLAAIHAPTTRARRRFRLLALNRVHADGLR
jgi:hypothetical protein